MPASNRQARPSTAPRARGRINGKLIKHPPPQLGQRPKDTIQIGSSTPFISGLKRVQKQLKVCTRPFLTVQGLGKSIEKVLALGVKLMELDHVVEVRTSTLRVVDEFTEIINDECRNDVDNDDTEIMRAREVSKVELRVYV
ncbi:hypothetical protein NADFUDRAFT_50852 [Nadsonia fulvescens var. elongata DSM 6958]|uniref:Uncharacterized protein n=1 Tax=Nadsonia fulvescens var. elongata DSM 6958 TaxID=857566 RepID=A0A1E3PJP5_9ASCO|nr:hypothetical protein NADFUDRAFT_50852 [Nadsonia fulvescens var. elongata DSM 6958]